MIDCLFQIMFDWNWIFVAGEVCVACAFYWSSRNDRKFSSLIEVETLKYDEFYVRRKQKCLGVADVRYR